MLPDWLAAAPVEKVETLGLYIHVPFCRRACHYCDFYFTPRASLMGDYAEALLREIDLYAPLLERFPIETVFLGGGTPSWLPIPLLERIFQRLYRFSSYQPDEVTIEANPEDITTENLRHWQGLGVTRVSVGIQSFSENVLQTLGRYHAPAVARQAVEKLASSFFDWNADLIFAVPGQSVESFLADVRFLIEAGAPHLSLYGLTIEERTVLHKKLQRGRFSPPNEDAYRTAYLEANALLQASGFIWYEISNYARPGRESLHNWRYWLRKPYLGLGPSAHSYLPHLRWANLRNLKAWVTTLGRDSFPVEFHEELTIEKQRMEVWLTQFRTRVGVMVAEVPGLSLAQQAALCQTLEAMAQQNLVEKIGAAFRLTPEGALLSDALILQLETAIERAPALHV